MVSTRTLSHDLNRFWQVNIRGKEDPYLKISEGKSEIALPNSGIIPKPSAVNNPPRGYYRGGNDYIWALRDINLEVEQGEVLGIIGKNGAGKSTLLKILSKVTAPTTGTVKARGRIASLLEVGTGFHSEMTGRENIYMNGAIMGMTKAEITRKLDEIINFAGVEQYIDTPVKRYSSGMTVRLGFAVAAHLEPEILVVDEVLAVGDAEFQDKAVRKMEDASRGEGRTILFVSHNMASIRKLCGSGILLENGVIKVKGKTSDIIDKYLQNNFYPKSIFSPQNNIVKELSVKQIRDRIFLRLKYESEKPLKQPNFGFVIYDSFGYPVFGTNPIKSGVLSFGEAGKKGQVEAIINSPQLVDGKYQISVWFSDGIARDKHIFHNDRCLNLDVANMNSLVVSKDSSMGPVIPSVDFIFS